jgi:4-hydroxy-tetrahydrodipicolinate reductase
LKKIRLGLVGASGKMGLALRHMLHSTEFSNVVTPFIAVSSKVCSEFSFSITSLKNVETEILEQVDVWIDFSSIQQTFELLEQTQNLNTPIVCGVTGFSESEFTKIKNFAKKRPLFWASNLSLGLWTLRQALKTLSLLSDFDFAIEEIHHTLKIDNPSGTAKTLHQDLESMTHKKIAKPNGLRLGGVFGIHKVTAASKSELITFEHTALNREVFAEGALKAARWIITKKVGYYSMEDLASSLK